MVGKDIAEKFSAIAALNVLERSSSSRNVLIGQLAAQGEFFVGEQQEERRKIQQHLLDMSSIIQEAGLTLKQKDVSRAAFMLVGQQSAVIGGEQKALEEVYGLLYSRNIEQKLIQAFPDKDHKNNDALRVQKRQDLGKAIFDTLRRFSGTHKEETMRDTIMDEVLQDSELSFYQIHNILTVESPVDRYAQVRKEIHREFLKNAYLAAQRRDELIGYEERLIDQLGFVPNIIDNRSIIPRIADANRVLQEAEGFRASISARREELLRSGVRTQTLDDAMNSLNNLQQDVLSAQNIQGLSQKIQPLSDSIWKMQKRISSEIKNRVIDNGFDDMYGEEFKTARPRTAAQIKTWVYHEFERVDSLDSTQVKAKLEQLASLPQEHQLRVLEGSLRLDEALRRQRVGIIPVVISPEIPSSVESPATIPTEVTQVPEKPVEEEGWEHRRVRINTERIVRLHEGIPSELSLIDLSAKEIPSEVKENVAYPAFRALGTYWFGHPDIVRLITEEHPHLQDQVRELREHIIYLEREQESRATRTSI